MNWELFYLVCFVVGFTFSVFSFVAGLSRFHFHVPKHLHFGGGHGVGHAGPVGHAHGGAPAGHAAGHASTNARTTVKAGHLPIVNPMTMAAFLTWFGGTGYLLVHLRHIWVFAGLVFASLAGTIGAGIVFWFVAKVLMARDFELDPMDFEMVGVLGRVSSGVRTGGTGEIIFVQQGVRKPCAARSEGSEALVKGEEVVVTRYERGIAYVRRWDDLTNPAAAEPEKTATDS
ncbi:MAG TPA: hypothetical protein VN176_05470 [Verrucomicrobiae bacterium]|jgi:hypothetical protein|nr:hypothetical protein [Verrucomicrobiae bacterium]